MYRSRILKEASEAAKLKDSSIYLFVENDNLFTWTAYISGPADTPFRDSFFELKIKLDNEYPVKPPKIV